MLSRQRIRTASCLLSALILASAPSAAAEIPLQMSYQVMLTDEADQPLSDRPVVLVFGIYDEGEQLLWTETHNDSTNSIGVVSIILGETTPLPANEFGVPLWLDVSVDGEPLLPRRELVSAPYAFRAFDADRLGGHVTDSYALRENLASAGTINDPTNPVDWTKLKGIPAGFADGADDEGGGAGDGHSLDAADGDPVNAVYVDNDGHVGVGTTSPITSLHCPGVVFVQGNTSYEGVVIGSQIDAENQSVHITWQQGQGLSIHSWGREFGQQLFIDGDSPNVGIGTAAPQHRLHVYDDTYAYITLESRRTSIYGAHRYTGVQFVSRDASGASTENGFIRFDDTSGDTFDWDLKDNPLHVHNYAGFVYLSDTGNLGIGTTTPASRLDVRGNITVRSESDGEVLIELGEGLDYAEGFEVSEHVSVKPGAVLVIDAANPGKLALCTEAYDTRVAGIVAGGNGLGSGVRLGSADFPHDVALAGRVYCNVDAIDDAVEPGDLLTTSAIPGYAMKATDRARASGAILGKAMERLEKGTKGQILVLVSLQ